MMVEQSVFTELHVGQDEGCRMQIIGCFLLEEGSILCYGNNLF